MTCPQCLSTDVYKSKSGSASLRLPWSLFVVCLRCHRCRKQFLRRKLFLGGEHVAPLPRRVARPRLVNQPKKAAAITLHTRGHAEQLTHEAGRYSG